MIIQASHMNYSFMQRIKEQQEQGKSLGSAAQFLQDSAAQRLGNGLNVDEKAGLAPTVVPLDQNPAQQADSAQSANAQQGPQTIGAVVADEVIRRLEATTNEGGEQGEQGELKDNSDLRNSLGQTLDWIRERFGDDMATAAAGVVLSSTSSEVTEESIGEGLLRATQIIDRNFGIAAGDATMANLNGNVNVALNDYFDNGKYETFHAETTSIEASGVSADGSQSLSTRLFVRTAEASTEKEVDPNQVLLEQLQKELENVAELQDLSTQLEEQFNPTKVTAANAIAAYTEQYTPNQPLLANIAV